MVPRVLSSVTLHRGRIFDVVHDEVELPSGLRQSLSVVRHPGAVGVVALFSDGSVALVRQYRHAIGRELLEIPAGRLEAGESPERAALRELEEETGLRGSHPEPLGSFFPAPGFCSEELHLFVVRDPQPVSADRAPHDADEELSVRLVPLSEALEICAQDAKSWIALARLAQRESTASR
jgi:ADP-ribose pyrophosphatase